MSTTSHGDLYALCLGRKKSLAIENKKVAIFGGTFDPIHKTHINIIQYIVDHCNYDYVIVMPTAKNPLKSKEPLAHISHRLSMIHKSVNNMKQVLVYEPSSCKSRYTYDSLHQLVKVQAPQVPLGLILGSDNLLRMKEWKNIEKLLSIVEILLVPRPNYDIPINANKTELLAIKKNATILKTFPQSSINSTKIRDIAQKNGLHAVRRLLTDTVISYLSKNHVYDRK